MARVKDIGSRARSKDRKVGTRRRMRREISRMKGIGRLGGGNRRGKRRRRRINGHVKIRWKDSMRKRRGMIFLEVRG